VFGIFRYSGKLAIVAESAGVAGGRCGGRLRAALVVMLVVVGVVGVVGPPVFAADTSPPTQPGVIAVSSVTSSSMVLKWASSSDNVGIQGYRVYRGPSASSLALIATTEGATSYSAKNLRSGYSYTFGVTAIDAAGNESPMRTTVRATLASSDSTAPAAPSSSSVSLKPFSSSRIDIVWAASTSTDVAYYSVFRGGVLVGTVERPNTQSFSDNGLTASTLYSYTVQAVDSAGNRSVLTSAKTARAMASGAVAIKRGPYLSNVTGTSAVVSWWTNIATTGVLAVAGQPAITDPSGSVRHHAVTVTGLSAGTTYAYTVTSGGVSASGSLQTAALPGQTFSFAAIGDFGGGSPGEAQNAANIASAGTQFIQTVGDNIYPSAGLPDPNFSTTYSDFDGRFFKQFAPAVKSQAFFPANGNKEYYSDGEFWAAFPMPGANHSWYSYDWGDAHILVLDSEQPYAPGSEQYNFAQADLAAHQGDAWRVVVSPRPPYSSTSANSSSEATRQYLVPLFEAQNVNLVLSGNSHNYERTFPLTGGVQVTSGGITYVVTGGGGNGFNAFGSYTQPWTAFRESSYYEYTKVTVTPTSLVIGGVRADTNTVFDTATITKSAAALPDTVIDSAPSSATNSSSATFSFHSTITPATFECAIDGGTPAPCDSPVTYDGLADGSHSFSVVATAASGTDPTAATRSWNIDATAPTVPTSVVATPLGPSAVGVSWTASSDTGGVVGYDISRDGVIIGSAGPTQTSYADATATPTTTYEYAVRARDAVGNASDFSPSSAATTTAPVVPFTNGFEAGFTGWTTSAGLALQTVTVHSGGFAAEGNTTNGATYAKKTFAAGRDGYARVYINLKSAASQVNLLRMRAAASVSLGYVFVSASGQLGWRNDFAATTSMSSTVLGPGWHALELHMLTYGATSISEIWLDGTLVSDISFATTNLGTAPISEFQIGEAQTGRTYDVVFDDAAFGSQRIGP
jgi:hypothetical protein